MCKRAWVARSWSHVTLFCASPPAMLLLACSVGQGGPGARPLVICRRCYRCQQHETVTFGSFDKGRGLACVHHSRVVITRRGGGTLCVCVCVFGSVCVCGGGEGSCYSPYTGTTSKRRMVSSDARLSTHSRHSVVVLSQSTRAFLLPHTGTVCLQWSTDCTYWRCLKWVTSGSNIANSAVKNQIRQVKYLADIGIVTNYVKV